MKHIDNYCLDEVTVEDLNAYYPQALFDALLLLSRWRRGNPTRDSLWEQFCVYLDRVSDRLLGQDARNIESLLKSHTIFERMQLDGVTPLFVINPKEESGSAPSDKRAFRLKIHCPGNLRVLQLALWLILDAILSGTCQSPVDTDGLSGEELALLNEAEELVPRISVKMKDGVVLH